jgi:hypothetical protein
VFHFLNYWSNFHEIWFCGATLKLSEPIWFRTCNHILSFLNSYVYKKFIAFHGIWSFVTVSTRARHWSIFWPRWSQSTPFRHTPISVRSILLISLHLDLPSSLFLERFPTKILHEFLMYSVRATCPTHSIILHLTILIIFGEEYRSLNTTVPIFRHPSDISCLLVSDILISTLFSNIPSICFFL